ncbi:glycoside hydrolase family 2 protein [Hymenobacter sp. AT01-02]|uniref:glycoside hydrolase family 2 protein n=1 Tax=Hymenobacter sp. AT01-02 TaxID=1571877 RepID=UPI000696A61A|nr:hypothetical protein [Hymenobacter sp. AT01-02]
MSCSQLCFNVRVLLLVFILSISSVVVWASPFSHKAGNAAETVPLQANWRFRQVGKESWTPATVPGCVHTDLLAAGQIPDPLYRDNELRLQWIGKADWEYETSFTLPPATLQRAHLDLVLQGLDTYAEVLLNGVSILQANNMFREWRLAAKQHLRTGENRLLIRFRSPLREVADLPRKQGYELYSGNDEQSMRVVGDQGPPLSPYTRKAPYQYGWDWGPRFVTAGVWQPVYIEAWDEARLTNLHVVQQVVTPQAAQLAVEVEYDAARSQGATLLLETRGPDGQLVGTALEQALTLAPGRHTTTAEVRLNTPQLWYPAGYGAQPLYTVTARLVQQGQPLDATTRRIGLRTLQVRREPDQYGKSFEFVVNGIPVFAKGANWIPADIFPTRVTAPRYRQLLQAAKDCHMNMIRVWGGGIYEQDAFYDTCDELGLLVWQDFMFACTFYPGDDAFMTNVREEAPTRCGACATTPAWPCGSATMKTKLPGKTGEFRGSLGRTRTKCGATTCSYSVTCSQRWCGNRTPAACTGPQAPPPILRTRPVPNATATCTTGKSGPVRPRYPITKSRCRAL